VRPAPKFFIETVAVTEDFESNRAYFQEVFGLMLELHKEGGYAQVDLEKAGSVVAQVMTERMTFMARLEEDYAVSKDRVDPAGMPIGVLALTEIPYWYAKTTHLLDIGFYVRPEYRSGKVGIHLLRRARDEAEALKKVCFITITSPDRRPKRTRVSLESQMAGYVPLGYTLRLN
jgi:GNAT superfamily N-acetyltransferase